MPSARKKTGSQILKEWIRNIKKNSGKKNNNKKTTKENDYVKHHNNNNNGLDGSYYFKF
jgi:hypothetical protein